MMRKKYKTKFPVARIKKIMQMDEDVGKVAQATPVLISKALELFMQSLIDHACKETRSRNAKRMSVSHLKKTIMTTEQFDFLKDVVVNIPDPIETTEGDGGSSSTAVIGNNGDDDENNNNDESILSADEADDNINNKKNKKNNKSNNNNNNNTSEPPQPKKRKGRRKNNDDEDYEPPASTSSPPKTRRRTRKKKEVENS